MRKRILGVKAPMPGFIEPQLATLKAKPPKGDYLHEIKFDGYRAQAHLLRGKAKIYTRGGHDWTNRFAADRRCARSTTSAPSWTARLLSSKTTAPTSRCFRPTSPVAARTAWRFICSIFSSWRDVTSGACRWLNAKQILEGICRRLHSPVFYSQHFDVDADELFESARRMNLEGIVSKKTDAPYRSDRTESWIKVKCVQKARFPIVGFIPDVGGIAALYLGKQEGKELVYAGKVGSGFSHKTSMSVRRKLEALITPEQKLTRKVRKPKARWVEPKFFAEVEYRDITADGLLRQSSFKGMSE